MTNYLTDFMKKLYLEFNDFFSFNSDDTLERFIVPQGTNDGGCEPNHDKKSFTIRGRDEPSATETSKESSTLMKEISDRCISITFPILKCRYFRGISQFWITHRNMPHTDYPNPIEIHDPTRRWEFYIALNKK